MGFSKQYLVEPNINQIPIDFDHNSTELVDLDKALIGADIIVLLVDHKQFKEINPKLLLGKQVIDTRGLWSK